MSKLKDIAIGWYHFATSNNKVRYVMQQRLEICDTCPNKVQVSPIGAVIMELTNDKNNTFKCSLCNCPLAAMAAHPVPQCQANKWD